MSMQTVFGLLGKTLLLTLRGFLLFVPSFLVFAVLSRPEIIMNRGLPIVQIANQPTIHEIIPNTRWDSLKPCGTAFDEQQEFNAARQCVNQKAWKDSPISLDLEIPRCFIITVNSPDVFGDESGTFNFIPITSMFGDVGAVLGVYQPATRTVYIVENVDAAQVYRHETQHYMLHIHSPETGGGGHHQEIWHECEAPYYSPSIEAKMIGAIKELHKPQKSK